MVVGNEVQERLDAVRSKMAMARYHLGRFQDKSGHAGPDLEVVWASEFEGCMHCLHHCLDILGQAINMLRPVISKENFYFSEVVMKLPKCVLRDECEGLQTEAAWLTAFVNYSKHHNVVALFQQWFFISPTMPIAILGLSSFRYKGTVYESVTDAQAHAGFIFESIRARLETIFDLLSG